MFEMAGASPTRNNNNISGHYTVFCSMMESREEDTQTDPRIGSIVHSRYRITERIGSGGMGIVYRGERVTLGRPVAIKFLQDLFVTDNTFRSRFDREAKAMSKLSHPYCVSVIDFGVDDAPYIVMDWVAGVTLKTILAGERISVARAMKIMHQLLAALAHAHAQGIIHRDIKPDNIMISEATGVGEHIRIFDFGLAKLLDASKDTVGLAKQRDGNKNIDPGSVASQVIGTPNYISPEQSKGEKVDARADLYSAAVILFEMLSGRKPFIDDEVMEVIRMHREVPPPALKEVLVDGSYSPELEGLVNKALAKSRNQRFQTAEEFAAALRATPEGASEEGNGSLPPPAYNSPVDTGEHATSNRQPPDLSISSAPPRPGQGPANKRRTSPMVIISIVALLLIVSAIWFVIVKPEKKETWTPGTLESSEKNTRENKTGIPDQSFADVQTLIKAGKHKDAIGALKKLRRLEPRNAHYPFAMGNLFFAQDWWGAGIAHYKEAIRLDATYGERSILIGNAIKALGNDRTYRKARSLILNDIGDPALPLLTRAAKEDDLPKVRNRASAIVKRFAKRP
jgi:serine/threonine-protein kinase